MNRTHRRVPRATLLLVPIFFIAVSAPHPLAAQEPDKETVAAPLLLPRPSPDAAAASPSPDPSPAAAVAPLPPLIATRSGRSLGPDFDMDLLQGLPMSNGVWSVFETIEPTAILDRMDSGGLYVGEAGLTGIRGSSWTQASWRLGDLDITDPDRTGTPLFFADPEALDAVEISAGLRPADQKGSGPGNQPVRPASGHTSGARACRSARFLPGCSSPTRGRPRRPSRTSTPTPADAFRVDGPLIKDRLGLLVSGTLTRALAPRALRPAVSRRRRDGAPRPPRLRAEPARRDPVPGRHPGPLASLRGARPLRRRRRRAVRSAPDGPVDLAAAGADGRGR